MRIWWNWQTRYFEVVVEQSVQVQVLLCAPFFLGKMVIPTKHPKDPPNNATRCRLLKAGLGHPKARKMELKAYSPKPP